MNKGKKKHKNGLKKTTPESSLEPFEQDDYFYFIVGYTEGGAPYGITWEEQEELERIEQQRELRKETKRELVITEEQLHSIAKCFDRHHSDERMELYLNLVTGDIVRIDTLSDDEEDVFMYAHFESDCGLDYEYIPLLNPDEKMRDLYDFAYTVQDVTLKRRLMDQLGGGRKRIKRFMNVLSNDRAEFHRYADFKKVQDRNRVLEWLSSIGCCVKVRSDNAITPDRTD